MPDLSNAADSTTVSIWIGIDGLDVDANPDAIVIQAGVDAGKGPDGAVTYNFFYEWYPNPATYVSSGDFTAAAGESKFHYHTTRTAVGISLPASAKGLRAYSKKHGRAH